MGSQWNAYQPCITTANGPNPFQTCKFPFESNGQFNTRCVYSLPTPSAKLDICNEFHAQVSLFNHKSFKDQRKFWRFIIVTPTIPWPPSTKWSWSLTMEPRKIVLMLTFIPDGVGSVIPMLLKVNEVIVVQSRATILGMIMKRKRQWQHRTRIGDGVVAFAFNPNVSDIHCMRLQPLNYKWPLLTFWAKKIV